MTRTETSPATMSLGLAVPTVLLYAAGYPIGAATIAVMSPFLVILVRFAASAVLLWGALAVRRVELPPRRQLGHAAVAGLLTQGVQFIGCYWGLSHGVPAGLAALIVALNPVATSAIMMVFLGHRESRWGVVALVLATVSVVLACAPSLAADHHLGLGIVAVIVGMLGLSVGGIHQGRRCAGMDPMLITAIGDDVDPVCRRRRDRVADAGHGLAAGRRPARRHGRVQLDRCDVAVRGVHRPVGSARGVDPLRRHPVGGRCHGLDRAG
jgi:drug/metabolite transporter (DMT)-like permease